MSDDRDNPFEPPAPPAERPEPSEQPAERPVPLDQPVDRHAPLDQTPDRPTAYPYGPTAPPLPPAASTEVPRVRGPRISSNVLLFIVTLASSSYWGFLQYQQFYADELRGFTSLNPLRNPEAMLGGMPFGFAMIAILLAHEMGHYLACRRYGIAASLPYFLPIPPPIIYFMILPGTMGAVIRIRSPITSRRALFDIAVAGPIAGWVVALPVLAFGLSLSRPVSTAEIESAGTYLTLGEPLIWDLMSRMFGPEAGPSEELVMHPLAFVGWFAMLITAMNLLPIGQLDGGHLIYSLRSRLHRPASIATLAFMLYAGVTYFLGWIVFATIISVLFAVGGFRHPKPLEFDQPLGTARILLALLCLAIFVTSFMLTPITIPGVGLG